MESRPTEAPSEGLGLSTFRRWPRTRLLAGEDRTMDDKKLREHLVELLQGGHAHPDFETAIANLPVEKHGLKPPGLPHTPWRLLEHMRIAQWDILGFSTNPQHV